MKKSSVFSKCLIALFILVINSFTLISQKVWLNAIEKEQPSLYSDIAFDEANNFYCIGFLGKSNEDVLKTIIIKKYNESGQIEWEKEWLTAHLFLEPKIVCEGKNIYITATIREKNKLNENKKIERNDSGYIAFISKIDDKGIMIWTKEIKSNSWIDIRAITLTDKNNIVCGGRFADKLEIGNKKLEAKGTMNGLVFELNPEGEFLWAKQIAAKYSSVWALTIDKESHIIIGGHLREPIQKDVIHPYNYNPIALLPFISLLDEEGNEIWTKKVASTGEYSCIYGLATDKNNDIYIAGMLEGESIWGNTTIVVKGKQDAFLSKFNKNGEYEWLHLVGSENSPKMEMGISVNINKNDEILWTGVIAEGTEEIDAIPVKIKGESDIFMAKYTPNGKIQSAIVWGGNREELLEMTKLDVHDNIYMLGNYTGKTEWSNNSLPTSNNKKQAFVAKISMNDMNTQIANMQIDNINIDISPNPAKKEITIKVENLPNKLLSFSVSDAMGKLIMTENVAANESWNSSLIVEDWAVGIYMFTFELENGMKISKKLVKE